VKSRLIIIGIDHSLGARRLSTVLDLDRVRDALRSFRPRKLELPVPPRADHADHMLLTALEGHTKLAADHILHPSMRGKLVKVLGSLSRRAYIEFIDSSPSKASDDSDLTRRILSRALIYDLLLEILWNLVGVEPQWARLDPCEVEKGIELVLALIKDLESIERREYGEPTVLRAVIEEQLRSMKIVNKGNSMLAQIAERVEKELDSSNLASSYFNAMAREMRSNLYRVVYERGMCKFGNDYALGLRWLRHLGYVQVSTNPALAARAYDDDPELWERFREYAIEVLSKEHPEWFKDPERYADDIAMEATRFGLMENFLVFRVPFILSEYHDGLVSYQLNPLIANDVGKSVEAAKEFYRRLERDLKVYDEYLLWGYDVPEKGRPNLVIKVAAAYPESMEIAERLNELGIGQNITVSYSVAQEILVGVAALRGMARALRRGIIPTQTYDTNMGGRLEDHLRETIAASLLRKALSSIEDSKREEFLDKLAERLGAPRDAWSKLKSESLESRIEFLCGKRVLGRDLLRREFIEALAESGAFGSRDDIERMLEPIERALKLSGTFVAKRVYEILFAPWNREKWVQYLVKEVGISREEAEFVIDRLDLLPASKRKPIDTLYTFASRNMTNTEFPNHQLKVVKEVEEKKIDIDKLRESVMQPLDKEALDVLMKYEDFVKAYEASPEVNELLKSVGIELKYGSRGVRTDEWPKYGPCLKTMREFINAYLRFRDKCVETFKQLARELGLA